jgi:G:T/U-mismatch repair DNA glycosylase
VVSQLQDILAPELRILLVAINPAPPSANSGQHFATPTNAFWRLLHASRLTTRLYAPSEALAEEQEPGPGLKRTTFAGATVFVLPNPAGATWRIRDLPASCRGTSSSPRPRRASLTVDVGER